MSLPVSTNKTQPLTCGIVNCRCSGYSSGTARIKSSCNLIGKCFEMPNVSYTSPSDCLKTPYLLPNKTA